MPEYNLPQAAADALIASRKRRVDARQWDYPGLGGAATIPLLSADRRERFFLDLRRSRIDYAKGTYQNRGRQVVVLVRLDFGGRPHRNPDGNGWSRRTSICTERDTAPSGRFRFPGTDFGT